MSATKECGTPSASVASVMISVEAPDEMQPTSAIVVKTPAERNEVVPKFNRWVSADTTTQLHSTGPFIPTDLVQNTAE
jgi:hypothetical protein